MEVVVTLGLAWYLPFVAVLAGITLPWIARLLLRMAR